MSNNESSLYLRIKSQTFKEYEGYQIGVYSGIVSGSIVTIALLVFGSLKTTTNIFISSAVSILFIALSYYLAVLRPIKLKKDYWNKFG